MIKSKLWLCLNYGNEHNYSSEQIVIKRANYKHKKITGEWCITTDYTCLQAGIL